MEETEERIVEYEDMRPLWTRRSPAGGGREGSDGDEEDT